MKIRLYLLYLATILFLVACVKAKEDISLREEDPPPQNNAPLASDDSFDVSENSILIVSSTGVLGNDWDSDGDSLESILIAFPRHGSLILNADGSFNYTPDTNYFGSDSFTYKANDRSLQSNIATVSITVHAVNDAPIAVADNYSVDEDAVLTMAAPGVLGNDSDPEGDALSAQLVSDPSHGSLTLNANGSFSYTPDSGYVGQDIFTYQASDQKVTSLIATVTITVKSVNQSGDLVGHWKFEDNNGDNQADDSSGNGNHGTLHGAVFASGALDFDGSNDYVDLGGLDVNGSGITIAAWIQADAFVGSRDGRIVSKATGNQTQDHYWMLSTVAQGSETRLRFRLKTNGNTDTLIATSGNLNTNQQYYVAAVYEGSFMRLYLDGVEVGSMAKTGTVDVNSSVSAWIGYNPNQYGPFDGLIGDVRIYDRGLSQQEVLALIGDNRKPLAADDNYSVLQGETLVIDSVNGVLGNDFDPNGDSLTAVLVSGPSQGSLSLNPNGSFSYASNASFTGEDSFVYRANDGSAESNSANVKIYVTDGTNDAPTITSLPVTNVTESRMYRYDVAATDPDINDTLTFSLTLAPSGMSIDASSGLVSWTPNSSQIGVHNVTVEVEDSAGATDSQSFTITVAQAVGATCLLCEDFDDQVLDPGFVVFGPWDKNEGTWSRLEPPQYNLDQPGRGGTGYSFTSGTVNSARLDWRNDVPSPWPSDEMYVSFWMRYPTYTVTSGHENLKIFYPHWDGASSYVHYSMSGVNQVYYSAHNKNGDILSEGIWLNCPNQTDGYWHHYEFYVKFSTGESTFWYDGVEKLDHTYGAGQWTNAVYYISAPSIDAQDPGVFSRQVDDWEVWSGMPHSSNNAPVAHDDSYSLNENETFNISTPGILSNDSNPDNDPLTAVLVTPPSHGTLSLNTNGSFAYTPNIYFVGSDSFTYQANDGSADSNTATVSLTIKEVNVNQAPLAVGDAYSVNENNILVTLVAGVLINDSDPDGDSLSAILVTNPIHGTVSFNADGTFMYTPQLDYVGLDSFSYQASDGSLESNIAAVSITVHAVNDAPIAVADNYSVDEDAVLTMAAPGVLGNDSDPDGDTLSAQLVSNPNHGNLSLNANGSFSYTPDSGYVGQDTFTYQALDQKVTSLVATVTITVKSVNQSGDLLGHWKFEDNNGDNQADDSSGNGNHGTLHGVVFASGALDFDGSNDYVDLGGLDVNGSGITIAAWIQADSFVGSRDGRIVSKATGSQTQDHYWMLSTVGQGSDTRLRFRLKTNGNTDTLIATSGHLNTNQKYYVAAVYDGTSMRLYLDGVEVGSLPKSGSINVSSSVSAWIGYNPNQYGPFDGLIGDVRIYNRGLSQQEILALIPQDNVNDPPQITSNAATTITVGSQYQYGVQAVDPDVGDTLGYSLDISPSGMSINTSTGLISWVPISNQLGPNSVTVRVEDLAGAFDTQSFSVTVTDSGGGSTIPELDRWEAQMLSYGATHRDKYFNGTHDWAETYYDAQRVFYNIADYTGDSSWLSIAEFTGSLYSDDYVLPNNGGVPGYWNFTHGLTEEYFRNGDNNSKDAAILLSYNAAYCPDSTTLEWTQNADHSRPVAYCMMSYLNAERLGIDRRSRLTDFFKQALGHLDQWFIDHSDSIYAPFMFGLTAEALIMYWEQVDQDPRVFEKIKMGADWTWENMWVAEDESFLYRMNESTSGSPTLNLLIAPIYAWLYLQTGDIKYRDIGDQIFAGGVKGAWLDGSKQFNQNYRWSFDYVKWRNEAENKEPLPQEGDPELPRIYINTTYDPPTGGVTHFVGAGDNLQATINAAQPGDIIELQAGATFTGNFTLPNKAGSDWIYIRSSAHASLPAPGTRVSPSHASLMARIQTSNNMPAMGTKFGAHHYRIIGIEFASVYSGWVWNMITLSYDFETDSYPQSDSDYAHHIVFDRCYMHGETNQEVRGAVNGMGKYIALIDSHVSDIHIAGYDSQAFGAIKGAGPYKIVNNYLEAAGENVLFGGGGDQKWITPNPSDIEIRHNHFYKPLSWKNSNWTVKNLFELKMGNRVLFEGNLLENNWVQAQRGAAILLTPRENFVENVTIRNNVIRNTVIGMIASPTNWELNNILIENNLFYQMDYRGIGIFSRDAGGNPNGVVNLIIRHNTVHGLSSSAVIFGDSQYSATDIVYQNNITSAGAYEIMGSGAGAGTSAIQYYCNGYDFDSNVIIGGHSQYYTGDANIRNIYTPADDTAVGFSDMNLDNIQAFRLLPNSPYKNLATDGGDLGADIDAILEALGP